MQGDVPTDALFLASFPSAVDYWDGKPSWVNSEKKKDYRIITSEKRVSSSMYCQSMQWYQLKVDWMYCTVI